jgi:hypothetical protein
MTATETGTHREALESPTTMAGWMAYADQLANFSGHNVTVVIGDVTYTYLWKPLQRGVGGDKFIHQHPYVGGAPHRGLHPRGEGGVDDVGGSDDSVGQQGQICPCWKYHHHWNAAALRHDGGIRCGGGCAGDRSFTSGYYYFRHRKFCC